MLRRRFALLVVVLAASATIAGACSSDPSPPPPPKISETDTGTVAAGICPKTAPKPGEACVLPEGTTCAFGACGTPIAECRRGAWVYGENPPPQPACPAPEPPPSESACPPCWPTTATCTYGTCSGPDASMNTAVASCPNGTWTLQFTLCSDAGADVQGDAAFD